MVIIVSEFEIILEFVKILPVVSISVKELDNDFDIINILFDRVLNVIDSVINLVKDETLNIDEIELIEKEEEIVLINVAILEYDSLIVK
jgi:hypothetical protein